MFDAVSDWAITEEFPEAATEDEREHKHNAQKRASLHLSEHFSRQVRDGRYRDVPERVLFAHSEPGNDPD